MRLSSIAFFCLLHAGHIEGGVLEFAYHGEIAAQLGQHRFQPLDVGLDLLPEFADFLQAEVLRGAPLAVKQQLTLAAISRLPLRCDSSRSR